MAAIDSVLLTVDGVRIADEIFALKANELVTSFSLGELGSAKMLPDVRLQERFDRFFVMCDDRKQQQLQLRQLPHQRQKNILAMLKLKLK